MLYHNIFDKNIKADPQHKYGVVVAEFNKKYTEVMLETALKVFQEKGAHVAEVTWVPGAYELPLGSQWLLDKGFDAVLTLGVVIRGDTTHYDYVCEAAAQGILRVSLDNKKPVLFGVLTCENEKQVEERLSKAEDLAIATIEMANLNKK